MDDRLVPISVKKILVAHDGSEHSKKAVELSIDLAKLWNAEISLIHVREDKKVPEGFKEWAESEKPGTDYFDLVCQRDQFLGEAEERIKKAGVQVELICVQGDPADEILRAIEENNVDLIVMGNRGLGGFSRTFMGSVSMKVCNHAPSTCITVK